jgi:hypothetical protein
VTPNAYLLFYVRRDRPCSQDLSARSIAYELDHPLPPCAPPPLMCRCRTAHRACAAGSMRQAALERRALRRRRLVLWALRVPRSPAAAVRPRSLLCCSVS